MNHLYPKQLTNGLLALAVVFTALSPAAAQCPVGTTPNTAGTYNNAHHVCISTNFSGSITLNNGAIMYIVNGGNFTGDIDAKGGSTVEVWSGGTFNPANSNNFAGGIEVKSGGKATLGSSNFGTSSGFALLNQGTVTWAKAWNGGNNQAITNGACGTMTFTPSLNIASGSTINNNGIMMFKGSLNTSSGSTIDNRGAVTVEGDIALTGYYKNQWKSVFKGNNNNFNTGDSIINMYTMTFVKAATGTLKLRNDGLFWVKGSLNLNSGSGAGVVQKASNAVLRVDGAISNNVVINSYGAFMYVAGSFGNNGTVKGNSNSQKLRLNQAPGNGTMSNTNVGTFTPPDTTSFAGGQGNPATCNVLLPITVTTFKGAVTDNGIQLTWATLTEQNGKKFVIEYSTDAISFTVAGEVAAKGNSNSRIDYSYLFTKNTGSTLYFRLNMVDIDGREEYSNIVLVKAGVVQTISAGVYPNPFTEKLQVTLSLSRSTPVAIKLFDMNGRIVKSQLNNGQSGTNKFTLTDLSGLQPGLYLVEVTAGEEKWMQKVIR